MTSIVRYEKNSEFPAHDHPEGEEILVLEGVFSDEHGDWPAGSYLRQYADLKRHHLALCTYELPWRRGPRSGIELKSLYTEAGFPDEMRLERWEAGASPGPLTYPGGVEILVLKGTLEDEQGSYPELSWLRLPPAAKHTPVSRAGCELYLKTGAVAGLRSVSTA